MKVGVEQIDCADSSVLPDTLQITARESDRFYSYNPCHVDRLPFDLYLHKRPAYFDGFFDIDLLQSFYSLYTNFLPV